MQKEVDRRAVCPDNCASLERGPLAQLVEHLTFNQVVARSNRARPTTQVKITRF